MEDIKTTPMEISFDADYPEGPKPGGKYAGIETKLHVCRSHQNGLPVVTWLLDETGYEPVWRFFGPDACFILGAEQHVPTDRVHVGYYGSGRTQKVVVVPKGTSVRLPVVTFYMFPERPTPEIITEAFGDAVYMVRLKEDYAGIPSGWKLCGYACEADDPAHPEYGPGFSFPLYMAPSAPGSEQEVPEDETTQQYPRKR